MTGSKDGKSEALSGAARAGLPALMTALLGGAAQLVVGDAMLGLAASTAVITTIEAGRGAVGAVRDAMQNAAEAEALAALAKRTDEIRHNVAGLLAATEDQSAVIADANAIVRLYLDAWTGAPDRKIRELVENAAVNAFDPDKYDEGLTRVLLSKIAKLEYGDIAALRQIASVPSAETTRGTTLLDFHLGRLVDERLAFSAYGDGSGVVATELGRKLLELIERRRTNPSAA